MAIPLAERLRPNSLEEYVGQKHLVDPEIGVIIMGDLNDDPMDKSCAKVLGAKRDAEGVGPHDFYNPFWRKLDSGIGTLAYKSQWNLFDQIIISGSLANGPDNRWHFYRADVLNKDFLKDTEGTRQGYPRRTYAVISVRRFLP